MKYLIGNWKMSISKDGIKKFLKDLKSIKFPKSLRLGIACPNVYIQDLQPEFSKIGWKTGSQNVSYAQSGAYTGEVSAQMLNDKKVDFCLVGHSERRTLFFEDNKMVNQKLVQLLSQKLTPILCIGETLEEFEKKLTKRVLSKQLKEGLKGIEDPKDLIVAYEPVWAIGTGKSANTNDIKSCTIFIKQTLKKLYPNKKIAVLYGGSVKPENAKQIFELDCVDGALVGGASLDCKKFFGIAQYM